MSPHCWGDNKFRWSRPMPFFGGGHCCGGFSWGQTAFVGVSSFIGSFLGGYLSAKQSYSTNVFSGGFYGGGNSIFGGSFYSGGMPMMSSMYPSLYTSTALTNPGGEKDEDNTLIEHFTNKVDELLKQTQPGEDDAKSLYNDILKYWKTPKDDANKVQNKQAYENLLRRLVEKFPNVTFNTAESGAPGYKKPDASAPNAAGNTGTNSGTSAQIGGSTVSESGTPQVSTSSSGSTDTADGVVQDISSGANDSEPVSYTVGNEQLTVDAAEQTGKETFSHIQGLVDNEKKALNAMGCEVTCGDKCALSLPSKMTVNNMKILKDIADKHNIPVAAAKNEYSSDQWIAGKIDDITADTPGSNNVSSYTIECKVNNETIGRYGFKYKVTPVQSKDGTYKVEYVSGYSGTPENLYCLTSGAEYEFKDGHLTRTGQPLISTANTCSYQKLTASES